MAPTHAGSGRVAVGLRIAAEVWMRAPRGGRRGRPPPTFRGIELIPAGRDPRVTPARVLPMHLRRVHHACVAIASIRAARERWRWRRRAAAEPQRLLRNLDHRRRSAQEPRHPLPPPCLGPGGTSSPGASPPTRRADRDAGSSPSPGLAAARASATYFRGRSRTASRRPVDRGAARAVRPTRTKPPGDAGLRRRRRTPMAVAHYLEALDWQREVIKIHAVLGGKNPPPPELPRGRDGDADRPRQAGVAERREPGGDPPG